MTSNGQPYPLTPAMVQFRQPLSLDPNWMPSMPDLTKVDAKMIGPITDLMTVYVDLWLMNKIEIFRTWRSLSCAQPAGLLLGRWHTGADRQDPGRLRSESSVARYGEADGRGP